MAKSEKGVWFPFVQFDGNGRDDLSETKSGFGSQDGGRSFKSESADGSMDASKNTAPSVIRLHDPEPACVVGPIRCRLAKSRADYHEAFSLVYRRYVAVGLIPRNPLGVRIAPQQLRQECRVLVAEASGSIVGTVSLVADGGEGLPVDRLFPGSVDGLRLKGHRLMEVGCLVSIDDSGRFPSRVYLALTRATIQRARRGGFDRMIASVHPRHAKFYERAMGFQRLTEAVPYDMVGGHPAVCVAGSANDAGDYRQPWRRHFFDHAGLDDTTPGDGMSPMDLHYFERLKSIIDGSWPGIKRRAA